MVTDFKTVLKRFISGSIDDFFSKIEKSTLEQYEIKVDTPIFKSDHSYGGRESVFTIDYRKLVHDNFDEIQKKSYYRLIFLILKNRLQKNYSKTHNVPSEDHVKEHTKTELREFLISYLTKSGLCFNNKSFLRLYEKFEYYLDNELEYDYCFATLLNFDGVLNSLELNPENHLHIRRITTEEFSFISGIKNNVESVDPVYYKLKFVIGGIIEHNKIEESNIRKLFEKTLASLKIFQTGDVQLGGIYFRDSEVLNTGKIFVLKKESRIAPSNPYVLKSNQLIVQFKKFHKDFSNINFTKGKYPFLYRSFTRFSKSLENSSPEEEVVDFVTSLESLYSTKEQELSYKFALRIALLLGTSSHNKINLQDFMSQIYNMRSKIVHGDQVPDNIDIGKEKRIITKNESIKILENITRNSIKIFLSLIEKHDSKEDIQKEIDRSIYDPDLQKKLSLAIKKLKYVDLDFLGMLT